MKKQYIKTSNKAPVLYLPGMLIYAMAIEFYHLPEWVWGVWGVLVAIAVITFIYRLLTEDGVDVVNRGNEQEGS